MQWVFGAMAAVALALVLLDLMMDWMRHDDMRQEVDELRKRTNIIDEVVTLHSSEIDELQRMPWMNVANRVTELEKRMMEPTWNQAVSRVKELEAESGKTVVINHEQM